MADPIEEAKATKADVRGAEPPITVKIPIDTSKVGKKSGPKKAKKKRKKRDSLATTTRSSTAPLAFPKHAVLDCIRIPKAILENNAGKECNYKDAATFAGLTYNGEIGVELSSASKYGWLDRNEGVVKPTELLRRLVRPQRQGEEIDAAREAVQQAPVIGDVYKYYRGENFPEKQYLRNTAIDKYSVPEDKADSFLQVFTKSLEQAKLLEDVGEGKKRFLDVTRSANTTPDASAAQLKKLSKGVTVQATDTCFVMQPFAAPLGGYYESVYAPAIKRAGLNPVRADADMFGTGKIIDQIWHGIGNARVLIAELTTKNSNVFYELGIAHAKFKPVILVSSNENDVPFDLRHVRVIYYDMTDPYWGDKLVDKLAENILQALKDPTDAILFAEK